MIKANKPSSSRRGRPCTAPQIRSVQVHAQQLLIGKIEAGSGLRAHELEEAFNVGTIGVKQRTGRTWLRWKSGDRVMSRDQRDRIGRLAVKRGWLAPIPKFAFFPTNGEYVAFNSLRGYQPALGERFDSADELALQQSRESFNAIVNWVQSTEAAHAAAKARALAAIDELRAIHKATALDIPLEPPGGDGAASLCAIEAQLRQLALDLFMDEYWNA